MPKMLLIDLDGTVRESNSDPGGFIKDPYDQQLIKGAYQALAAYARAGYHIVGITNQAGVAYGYKKLNECIEEQVLTLKFCYPHMEALFFCPDNEGKECWQVTLIGEPIFVRATNWGEGGLQAAQVTMMNRASPPSGSVATKLTELDYKPPFDSYRKPDAGMLYAAVEHIVDEGIKKSPIRFLKWLNYLGLNKIGRRVLLECKTLNELFDDILMVGDMDSDAKASVNAGIRFLNARHWNDTAFQLEHYPDTKIS